MKRHLTSLALGALVSLALGGGAPAARAQDACAPTAPCYAGHPGLNRLHNLIHTPAPTYRPTHYTDCFWRGLGHIMTPKTAPPAPAPCDECATAYTTPEGYVVQPAYSAQPVQAAPARSAPLGPTRPNR